MALDHRPQFHTAYAVSYLATVLRATVVSSISGNRLAVLDDDIFAPVDSAGLQLFARLAHGESVRAAALAFSGPAFLVLPILSLQVNNVDAPHKDRLFQFDRFHRIDQIA